MKSLKDPQNRSETFWDHLEILRWKLLTVIGITALAGLGAFLFGDVLVDILLEIPRELGIDLIYIKPQEKFLAYLRAAVYLSMIVGVPVLIIELISFVMPALTPKEMRIVIPAATVVVLLYLTGMLYSYFFLLPYALGFFFEFGTVQVRAAWSIGAYIQLVGSITMVSGLIFLLPVVLWAAVRTGLVEAAQLAAGRKYVVLGLFIAAALFTPPDPFTQIVVASILYGLYELTLLLIRVSEYIKGGRDE